MSDSLRMRIRSFGKTELEEYVSRDVQSFTEEESLAVLENRFCTAAICQAIARNPRLTAFYSVRLALVAHRQTPQAHATKLVHYLFWADLVRLSVEVQVAAPVRRSIDTLLLLRVDKLTLGERIASARRCSEALIQVLVFDAEPKVFAALLNNQRVREEHLVNFASSPHARPEQLSILAADRKWSSRYTIRKALAQNPLTPRAVAASQLRYLSTRDRESLYENPSTSVYLRRCIERLSYQATQV